MRDYGVTIFYGAAELQFTGTTTYTRNAKGDISINQGNSQTCQYQMAIADFRRVFYTGPFGGSMIGTFPTANEFQGVFGTAAGGPSNPWSGGATAAQFQEAAWPYGIQIIDVFAWYSVQGASLSSGTLGATRTSYTADGSASLSAVDIVAQTAVTLTTTSAAAAPRRFLQAVTQPCVFESSDLTDVIVELILVTAGGGTARVYGIGCHCMLSF